MLIARCKQYKNLNQPAINWQTVLVPYSLHINSILGMQGEDGKLINAVHFVQMNILFNGTINAYKGVYIL